MCSNPIMIPNPYRGLAHVGLNRYHDCTSAFIPVPCGNCPVCVSLRQSYFVQRTQMESLDNYLFMGTLTYNNESLRKISILGRTFAYVDWADFQNMMKRIRKRGFKFKYFAVSEYGGERHRPHLHFILSVKKPPNVPEYDERRQIGLLEQQFWKLFFDEWRRNESDNPFVPKYKKLFTYRANSRGANYDFHYVDPLNTLAGEADVAFYVTKYILKSDKWLDKVKSFLKLNLPPEEFVDVWKLLKPKCQVSHNFGVSPLVPSHIRKGINLALDSESEYPFFINPVSGQTQPLSPYYQRRYLTLSDAEKFYQIKLKNNPTLNSDSIHETESYDPVQVRFAAEHYSKVKKMRSSIDDSFTYYLDYDSETETNLDQAQEKVSCRPDRTSWNSDDFQSGREDF